LQLFRPLSVLIEILDNQFNTTVKLNERIEEYKSSYKFYSELLHLFNAKKSTEIEINLLEKDCINNLKYFPVEKYLKKMGLNGYNFFCFSNKWLARPAQRRSR
jgi:hypothetical protein